MNPCNEVEAFMSANADCIFNVVKRAQQQIHVIQDKFHVVHQEYKLLVEEVRELKQMLLLV